MDTNIELLQYPVGRYARVGQMTDALLQEWMTVLAELPAKLADAVNGLDAEQLATPYRPGGWTVQQVVHHVADSHANAFIRIKQALTEDNPHIKTYDEKAWATLPDTFRVPVEVSLAILTGLHIRLIALLQELDAAQWQRTYFHPGLGREFAVWEAVALYAWHSRHHTAHITTLRTLNGWT
jgi:uncharacterized damage-inducible protein DinB